MSIKTPIRFILEVFTLIDGTLKKRTVLVIMI